MKPMIGVMACRSLHSRENDDGPGTSAAEARELGSGIPPPFGELPFYARLCRAGMRLGLTVYVFSPLDRNDSQRKVFGYTLTEEDHPEAAVWEGQWLPFPDLIYDRLFSSGRPDERDYRQAVRRMLALQPIPFLGRGLPGKRGTLRVLKRSPLLRTFVPATEKLAPSGQPRTQQLGRWLARFSRVFLKPEHGTHGKGAVLVVQEPDGTLRIHARDAANRSISESSSSLESLSAWISSFTDSQAYLIQPDLMLTSRDGCAYDIRSLVQKDGRGNWQITGMAVRRGALGSITSNLHGGGTAYEVRSFLCREFGNDTADRIMKTLVSISKHIPQVLEEACGRLPELGLDLGVDVHGRVWIIEANAKPGRSVFQRTGQEQEARLASQRPIAYAAHLVRSLRLQKQSGVFLPIGTTAPTGTNAACPRNPPLILQPLQHHESLL